VGALLVIGCILATLAVIAQMGDVPSMEWAADARDYLRDTVLK
jgi:hypothetical protein